MNSHSIHTQGMRIHTQQRWLRDAIELFSAMRFAIALLTIIALASVIGTVLKQNEPLPNYANQFGPFGLKCLINFLCTASIQPGGFC